jgi:EpsI family protein
LPLTLGSWTFAGEGVVDDETRDILKADDLMLREYRDSVTGRAASLFVAAFRSQRNGKTPHSPKNCLPGSGWTQLSSGDYSIDVGGAKPIVVNRYVVQHGDERSVVLYWYQSRDRVVASEYTAKFWVMADAIRLNRTDTALVRVYLPIIDGDSDGATRAAASFVQNFFGTLRQFLPA